VQVNAQVEAAQLANLHKSKLDARMRSKSSDFFGGKGGKQAWADKRSQRRSRQACQQIMQPKPGC
jgi:hypothetical protein